MKTIRLSKRTVIRTVSFSLALLLTAAGMIVQKSAEAAAYRTRIAYGYSQSLEELGAGLSNIRVSLEKGVYAGTATQLSVVAAELMKESGTAKSALSSLPGGDGELTVINRFLSQVGDFAIYLSKKRISGNAVTEAEHESLRKLSDTAAELTAGLDEIRMKFDVLGVWDGDIIGTTDVSSGFGAGMLEMEDTLTDYPTLIYDGQFSDHILTGRSKMLETEPLVSREEARSVAADMLSIEKAELADDSDEEGKMPSYGFTAGNAVISVTRSGGHVVYFRRWRDITDIHIDYDSAVKIAADYLAEHVSNTFRESYYFADEGVCVVNFAHREGRTICYPDLIKVGVALDTGEVVLYEARGYLMNHHDRTIPTPRHTVDEAKTVLSEYLTVTAADRAIIPTGGENEVFCYEFLCRGLNDEEILVYVDAETLEEQNIMILLKTDGGTLTK